MLMGVHAASAPEPRPRRRLPPHSRRHRRRSRRRQLRPMGQPLLLQCEPTDKTDTGWQEAGTRLRAPLRSDPSNGESNYLPYSLCAFKQLAGFTQNRIDRTKFQILASKRVYFNSKGSANVADQSQDRTETSTLPMLPLFLLSTAA